MITISSLKTMKKNKPSLVLLTILVYAFITIISQLLEDPSEPILWMILLVLSLMITKTCIKLINKNKFFRNGMLLISLCIFYLMIGAISIEYRIEQINYRTSQEKEDIIEIHYSFEHWNKGKIPADFIKVIPVGGKGFELYDISTKKLTSNTYKTTISFKLVDENIEFPTNTIVLYRVLGVFPIINIRGNEFDLPQRLSGIIDK